MPQPPPPPLRRMQASRGLHLDRRRPSHPHLAQTQSSKPAAEAVRAGRRAGAAANRRPSALQRRRALALADHTDAPPAKLQCDPRVRRPRGWKPPARRVSALTYGNAGGRDETHHRRPRRRLRRFGSGGAVVPHTSTAAAAAGRTPGAAANAPQGAGGLLPDHAAAAHLRGAAASARRSGRGHRPGQGRTSPLRWLRFHQPCASR